MTHDTAARLAALSLDKETGAYTPSSTTTASTTPSTPAADAADADAEPPEPAAQPPDPKADAAERELERFRAEWRQEVAARKQGVSVGPVRWKEQAGVTAGAAAGEATGLTQRRPRESSPKRAASPGKRGTSPTKAATKASPGSPKRSTSPTKPVARMPVSPKKAKGKHVGHVVGQHGARRAEVNGDEPGFRDTDVRAGTMAIPSTSALGSGSGEPHPHAHPHTHGHPAHATHAPSRLSSSPTKIPFPTVRGRPDRAAAVATYASAVEAEQSGRLNDALQLYRRAFKLDDNVDRLWTLAVKRDEAAAEAAAAEAVDEVAGPGSGDVVDPSARADEPYAFRRHIQVYPDYDRHGDEPLAAGPGLDAVDADSPGPPLSRLTALLASTPSGTTFSPADESLPLPLALLPAELVERVLAHLDVASIERFALTCWRARRLSAECSHWRALVHELYRPPMARITPPQLAHRHNAEWRTTFLEEERVRLDGCYIAVCHYIRPGAGEQWVAITHMITYHRFLRFYPDGLVLSFLTTDHPSDVVPVLRPNLRAKGLHIGRWRLVRADDDEGEREGGGENGVGHGHGRDGDGGVVVNGDTPAPAPAPAPVKGKGTRRRPKVVVSQLLEPGAAVPKYEFEMELTLRETNRGRWNKLDLAAYNSINLATGETLALSLRHQKPFYFSKVRSYHPTL